MRVALLLFVVVVSAQSQPPSPTPPKASQDKQEHKNAVDTAGQRDKKNPPQTIPVIPKSEPTLPAQTSQNPANYSADPTSSNWWLVGLTAVIAAAAIVQVFVYCRQAAYMRRGLLISMRQTRIASANARTARVSADVAKRSADTLVNSERAWVLVSNVLPTTIALSTTLATVNTFAFDLENKGRTVARLTGPYRRRFELLTGMEKLADIPDYGPSAGLVPEHESPIHGRILAPGQLNGLIYEPCVSPAITEKVADGIQKHKLRLYFYASLKYFDFTDIERELQFCYSFVPAPPETGYPGNWVLAGPKEYNKHK